MIPVGALTTVPCPERVTVSVDVAGGGAAPNVAVTLTGALTVSVHDPVPLHPPPLHPENTDPLAAAALSVTAVPAA